MCREKIELPASEFNRKYVILFSLVLLWLLLLLWFLFTQRLKNQYVEMSSAIYFHVDFFRCYKFEYRLLFVYACELYYFSSEFHLNDPIRFGLKDILSFSYFYPLNK